MEEKKRRQHYVWRYYLTAWENEKGKLSCLRNNKVFTASARDVANIRDFYRLEELSPNEIKTIETTFIDGYGSPEIQKINRDWIEKFNLIFKYSRDLEHRGLITDEWKKHSELHINNAVENLHSSIEDMGKPFLESLRNGDASFYQDQEGKVDFIYFICTQYFRTNMLKNNHLRGAKSIPVSLPPDFDPEKIWIVLSLIFTTNLGSQMILNNFICQILKNGTPTPFIAGDQPVINTKTEYDFKRTTHELEFYYPISPTIAFLLKKKSPIEGEETVEVVETEVHRYNSLIFQASEEQVYANNPETLKRFIQPLTKQ